jgi:predicted DNA-binding ribbon-helix-helix protein
VARDWEEFKNCLTYCFNCARVIEQENQPKKLDKRTLNKTGRIYQLGTRVRKAFLKKLKAIARKEKLKYVEVLERALDFYATRKKK